MGEQCGGGDQCCDVEGHGCQDTVTCRHAPIGRILCLPAYSMLSLAVSQLQYMALLPHSIFIPFPLYSFGVV